MRIIAINRFYRPDHSATAQMLTDLAEHLAASGHSLVVVTSRLGYDGGADLPPREVLGGVEVRRIWTTSFGRSGLVGRSIDYASFYVSVFIGLIGLARRSDVVIAKTDPPLLSVVAAMASRLKGFRLINWCQDLFPETAGALGMDWADGWLGGLARRLRNWSLRVASFNAVLHETMARRLVDQGLDRATFRILPNWADADIRPVNPDTNRLRVEWGLQDQFVVGYSGNLGRAHLADQVARLVTETCDIPGLTWLFVGGGAGIDQVRAAAAAAGADNVVFKPYQPREALSESLSVPDLHLISLSPACEGYIVPSKVYGVAAVARPVLFLGAPDGAVAQEMAGSVRVLDPARPQDWRGELLAGMAEWRGSAALSSSAAPAGRAMAQWRAELETLIGAG